MNQAMKIKTVTSMVFALMAMLTVPAVAAETLRNQLANHPSPYLALHGNDPLAWQKWDEKVLQRAQSEDKLIFLSIGYFTCHWCHVMQRESFSDPEVAAWVNQNFIPVKIDRELEEALDARLIEFAEQTRGRAGWPLNVFLTPEGYPLYAEMYLPRDEFLVFLKRLQDLWGSDPDGLRQLVKTESTAATPLAVHAWSPEEIESLDKLMIKQALFNADLIHGGFGETLKFPSAPQLNYLLSSYHDEPSDELKEFLVTTLDHMASQGLNDHVGGGFFRYSTDPDWQTPHFEKMLYDNAQLAAIYLNAGNWLSRQEYTQVALATLMFMQREMRTPSGAYVAALSAVDDSNVEGGYYLWNRDQLAALLTDDEYAAVQSAWLETGAAPLEAGYLPKWRAGISAMFAPAEDDAEQHRLLDRARSRMLKERQTARQVPVDYKLLAGWNGLALTAYSMAAIQTSDPGLTRSARDIRDYLLENLWDGKQLIRAADEGVALGQSTLGDYAAVAEGFWNYYKLSGDRRDLLTSADVANKAWNKFHSAAGWHYGSGGLLPASAAQAIIMDGALHSPSATLLALSCKLAGETGREDLKGWAAQAAGWGRDELLVNPFWYASHVLALKGPCRDAITQH